MPSKKRIKPSTQKKLSGRVKQPTKPTKGKSASPGRREPAADPRTERQRELDALQRELEQRRNAEYPWMQPGWRPLAPGERQEDDETPRYVDTASRMLQLAQACGGSGLSFDFLGRRAFRDK